MPRTPVQGLGDEGGGAERKRKRKRKRTRRPTERAQGGSSGQKMHRTSTNYLKRQKGGKIIPELEPELRTGGNRKWPGKKDVGHTKQVSHVTTRAKYLRTPWKQKTSAADSKDCNDCADEKEGFARSSPAIIRVIKKVYSALSSIHKRTRASSNIRTRLRPAFISQEPSL